MPKSAAVKPMNKTELAKLNGVTAVEISFNEKIGYVSATYVSQTSCPADCGARDICYANQGNTKHTTNRVNQSKASIEELATNEARVIDSLSGQLPLRIHVVGDCTTDYAAQTVAAAGARHRAKSGQHVWTYTHASKTVARESWGNVSVLASCDTLADIPAARAKGYATAVVVPHHTTDKAYIVDGIKLLPCPEQTGKAQNCSACKLCWNDDSLKAAQITIAFAAHSVSDAKKSAHFNILNN